MQLSPNYTHYLSPFANLSVPFAIELEISSYITNNKKTCQLYMLQISFASFFKSERKI